MVYLCTHMLRQTLLPHVTPPAHHGRPTLVSDSYWDWNGDSPHRKLSGFFFCFFFLATWGFVLRELGLLGRCSTTWATLSSLFFCVLGIFEIGRVSWTVCPGWLPTVILLISASWVARITGVSHRRLAQAICFNCLSFVHIFNFSSVYLNILDIFILCFLNNFSSKLHTHSSSFVFSLCLLSHDAKFSSCALWFFL
jgi:hypothetical protein